MHTKKNLKIEFDKQIRPALNIIKILLGTSLSSIPAGILGIAASMAVVGSHIFIIDLWKSNNSIPNFSNLINIFVSYITCVLTVFFSPSILLGNYYIKKLLRRNHNIVDRNGYCFQIMTQPRQYVGVRAFLDDADDIGHLRLTKDGIMFDGSYIKCLIPFDKIVMIELKNSGMRGLWLILKLHLIVSNPAGVEELFFTERDSTNILSSWRLTIRLYEEILANRQLIQKK